MGDEGIIYSFTLFDERKTKFRKCEWICGILVQPARGYTSAIFLIVYTMSTLFHPISNVFVLFPTDTCLWVMNCIHCRLT